MWVRRTCHISKMFFMKWAENFEEMSFLEVWFIIVWIFRAEPFLNYSIIYNHRYRLPLRYNFKWDYLEHFWVSHSNRQVTMSLNLLVYDAEYCQSPWTVTINVNKQWPSIKTKTGVLEMVSYNYIYKYKLFLQFCKHNMNQWDFSIDIYIIWSDCDDFIKYTGHTCVARDVAPCKSRQKSLSRIQLSQLEAYNGGPGCGWMT